MRRFDRRHLLRHARSALVAAALGETILPRTRRAVAAPAPDNVVRVLGISNGPPRDWAEFEKDTGLKVEWTPIGDSIGLFLHEMLANDAGDTYDIVTSFTGTYEILADRGLLLPIDTARLTHWQGVSPLIRQATPLHPDGKHAWSLPFQMNADAFGYCWKALGEPQPPAEVSWKMIWDDRRTLGKVGLDISHYSLTYCAIYLKYHKLLQIGDVAHMTRSECNSVADYVIERKKAGQFRAMFHSYDEQVQLWTNGEVLAQLCWEPATRAAQAAGIEAAHAYTIEGYDKWAQCLMIPAGAKDRGTVDKALTTIDWMMGGAYAAEKSADEGYLTPRPDLGLAYASERGWPQSKITAIKETMKKMDTKFLKDLFWDPIYTESLDNLEMAMARVRNA
jgi:spermidine/putrescine-binding protein